MPKFKHKHGRKHNGRRQHHQLNGKLNGQPQHMKPSQNQNRKKKGKQSLSDLIDAKLRAQDSVWDKRIEFEPAQDLKAATGGLTGTQQMPANGKGKAGSSSTANIHLRDADGFVEPKRQLFNPSKVRVAWKQPRPMGAGLTNFGNTCYLNATMQCLTYTPALANYCLSGHYERHHSPQPGFDAMRLVDLHVGRALTSPKRVLRPQALIKHLRQINKGFRFAQQQDAHEFFICLLDAMQNALTGDFKNMDARVKETTIVHQIFGGYLRSQIQCVKCKHCSNTFESFFDISLDIKQTNSLLKALHLYVRKELLFKTNSYRCDGCKNKVPATKQLTIHRMPNVLCFQLKRFSFMGFFGSKLRQKVTYPRNLNIHAFLSPAMRKRMPQEACGYRLYAVLVHYGATLSSGHYICYVRAPNDVWYCADDDDIRFSRENEVMNQQAYMLFYTRDDLKPPPAAYCAQKQPQAAGDAASATPKDAGAAQANSKRGSDADTKHAKADNSTAARNGAGAVAAGNAGQKGQLVDTSSGNKRVQRDDSAANAQREQSKTPSSKARQAPGGLLESVAPAAASDSEVDTDDDKDDGADSDEDHAERADSNSGSGSGSGGSSAAKTQSAPTSDGKGALCTAPTSMTAPTSQRLERLQSSSSTGSSDGENPHFSTHLKRDPAYSPVITTTDDRWSWVVQIDPPVSWPTQQRRHRWRRYALNCGWDVEGGDNEDGEDEEEEEAVGTAHGNAATARLREEQDDDDSDSGDSDDNEYTPGMEEATEEAGDYETDSDADGAVQSSEGDDEHVVDGAEIMREIEALYEEQAEHAALERFAQQRGSSRPVQQEAGAEVEGGDEEKGPEEQGASGEEEEEEDDDDGDVVVGRRHTQVLEPDLVDVIGRISSEARKLLLQSVDSERQHYLGLAKAAVLEGLSPEEVEVLGGAEALQLSVSDLPQEHQRSIKAGVSAHAREALWSLLGSDTEGEEAGRQEDNADDNDGEEEVDGREGHEDGPVSQNEAATTALAPTHYHNDDETSDDSENDLSFEDDDEEEAELHAAAGDSESEEESEVHDSSISSSSGASARRATGEDVDVVAWNVDWGTTEQVAKGTKSALWDGKRRPAVDLTQADANESVTTWDNTRSAALAYEPPKKKSKEEREREEYDEEMDRGRVKKVRGPKTGPADLKSKFNAVHTARMGGQDTIPARWRMKKRQLKQHKRRKAIAFKRKEKTKQQQS